MKSIQSVGILSCAKIMGAIYGALGLIFVPILFLTTLVSAFAGDHVNRMVAIAGGLAMMIFLPIIYCALGFGMGALSAWAYNVAAKRLGGIQVEMRD
jgi:hypothetical protein